MTVGVGRLQQIMRALSPAFGADVSPPAHGRRILLAPAPGEQHTFGLSMVTEFFMRAGWDVASTTGMHAENLLEWVQSEWFDVLGFSKGSALRVDDLAAAVTQARRHSRNGAMVVMVGGPLFAMHPEYIALVGADGTARDAETAPGAAEMLLGQSTHKT
jgi:methanogenic corrinoid protein MtbC1